MTTGLETEWDYSARKGRYGQKKIGKANEKRRKGKGKEQKMRSEWTRGKMGERGAPAPPGY